MDARALCNIIFKFSTISNLLKSNRLINPINPIDARNTIMSLLINYDDNFNLTAINYVANCWHCCFEMRCWDHNFNTKLVQPHQQSPSNRDESIGIPDDPLDVNPTRSDYGTDGDVRNGNLADALLLVYWRLGEFCSCRTGDRSRWRRCRPSRFGDFESMSRRWRSMRGMTRLENRWKEVWGSRNDNALFI